MKKILTLFCLYACSISISTAQNKPLSNDDEKAMKSAGAGVDSLRWTRGGTIGFNSTQTYLSNWAAGGQSAITFGGLMSYFIHFKNAENAWDNSLDMAYGVQLQDVKSRAIKTDDKFDFTSKYGRKASEKWYYAGLLNFRTQFAPGYEMVAGIPNYTHRISGPLAPAYLLIALGMDYKPSEKFTAFLSPISYRMILVNDTTLAAAGAFGVQGREFDTQGILVQDYEKTRTEIGGYGRAQFKTPITKNIEYSSKLELFTNYLDKPQNVDVNWENLISLKVESWLSVTLFNQMLYDDNTTIDKGVIRQEVNDQGEVINEIHDIGPGLQLKQVSGLNVSFKF